MPTLPDAGASVDPTLLRSTADTRALSKLLYGDAVGVLCVASAARAAPDAPAKDWRHRFFPYPTAVAEAVAWLSTEADARRDVYFNAPLLRPGARTRKQAEAALLQAALFADLDGAIIAPDSPLSPSISIVTSSGRRHAYWLLTHPLPLPDFLDLNHRLTDAVGADSGGWNGSKLLRAPNTPNLKHPGELVRVEWMSDKRLDPEQLDAMLPPLPATPRATLTPAALPRAAPTARYADPPLPVAAWCRDEFLRRWRGAQTAADRSGSLYRLAKLMRLCAWSEVACIAALADRDAALGWRKFTERADAAGRYAQLVSTADRDITTERAGRAQSSTTPAPRPSGSDALNTEGNMNANGHHTNGTATATAPLAAPAAPAIVEPIRLTPPTKAPDLLPIVDAFAPHTIAPTRWLKAGRIAAGEISLNHGPEETFKTTFWIGEALSLATGTSTDGCAVEQCPVLYVSAEMSQDQLQPRIDAWLTAHGQQLPGPGQFLMLCEALDISDRSTVSRLLRTLDALNVRPGLVVIDPLLDCFGDGEENSSTDAKRFMVGIKRIRDTFSCHVAIVHHDTKDKRGERGSGALRAAVDVRSHITRTSTGVRVECRKMRLHPRFHPFFLRPETVDIGTDEPSVILRATVPEATTTAPTTTTTPNETRVLGGFIRDRMTRGEILQTSQVASSTLDRTLKALTDRGLVRHEGRYYALAHPVTPTPTDPRMGADGCDSSSRSAQHPTPTTTQSLKLCGGGGGGGECETVRPVQERGEMVHAPLPSLQTPAAPLPASRSSSPPSPVLAQGAVEASDAADHQTLCACGSCSAVPGRLQYRCRTPAQARYAWDLAGTSSVPLHDTLQIRANIETIAARNGFLVWPTSDASEVSADSAEVITEHEPQ